MGCPKHQPNLTLQTAAVGGAPLIMTTPCPLAMKTPTIDEQIENKM